MPESKKTSPPPIPMKVPKHGVTVRMYNTGYGDCFLLAFPGPRRKPRYVLIDFGCHQTYTKGSDRLKLVAAEIAGVTGNHLDIVAITHEHSDHTYGFKYGQQIFKDLKIDDLWLSWAEDPTNEVVKQLLGNTKKSAKKLKEAITRLTSIDKEAAIRLQGARDILDFELTDDTEGKKETQLEYLKDKCSRQEDLVYRRPGQDPLTIPGVKDVRVYVLGPPWSAKDIKQSDSPSEIYEGFAAMSEFQGFAAAFESRYGDISLKDAPATRQNCPFDKFYDISFENARNDETYKDFFHKFYGFTREKGQGEEWRRIDNDWLSTALEIALKINNYINNTSLVLAIELAYAEPHKVLLFVGDAQVSNWLSWSSQDFAKELLSRTVLYKVGHHGSHNATLSQKGLEMMTDPGLVAMIPVDQNWAKETPGWEHPAPKLLKKLEEKTKGRILRSDTIKKMPEVLVKPDTTTEKDWQNFLKNIDWDKDTKNWIQYTIEG